MPAVPIPRAAVLSVLFVLASSFPAMASDHRPLGEMGARLPRARLATSLEGRHSCAVLGDGTVRCWGANDAGQLGNGTTSPDPTPVAVTVTGVSTAVAIATGIDHSCALLVTGRVHCWGANNAGQLGNGSNTPSAVPVQVSSIVSAVSLSAGSGHTCVRAADGRVKCWGENGQGQLGDSTRVDKTLPVDSIGLVDARAVTTGGNHSCAVRAGGTVQCWGGNASGQLGLGDTTRRVTPTEIPGLSGVTQVSAGRLFTCAVAASGELFCWGTNESGQFGNGTTTAGTLVPTPAGESDAGGVLSVSLGREHVCAILLVRRFGVAVPRVECWGQNASGQLGLGDFGSPILTPSVLSEFLPVMELAAGLAHTCALVVDERIHCWGANDAGQLGTGLTDDVAVPTLVLGIIGSITARGLAAGLSHSCAWRADGTVACWGRNGAGAIGDGTFDDRLTPVATGVTDATAVVGGDHHTCAVRLSTVILCWGRNIEGQVHPEDSREFIPSPNSVLPIMHASIAAGGRHTFFWARDPQLDPDGHTIGWGANEMSQLGDIPAVFSDGFVGVGPIAPVAIVAGSEHSCALAADGTVQCWGSNRFAQLGIGSTAPGPFATPQTVQGVFDAVSLAAGPFHTCAVRVDGRVQCWGRNDFRQLGDGTVIDRVFPVPVPGVAVGGAVALALGRTHSCVLTPSGSVRCWGRNNQGQLGDTTTIDRASPVFVQQAKEPVFGQPPPPSAALTSVVGIVAGQTHACALRVTGRPVCWGSNSDGQIGDGTNTRRTSATGVPSFTANMSAVVTMNHSNRRADVMALLNCQAGARFRVEISITQGGVDGSGHAHGRCTGGLERIPVRVRTHSHDRFVTGEAQATAVFDVRGGGEVLEHQEWTRRVNLELDSTQPPP